MAQDDGSVHDVARGQHHRVSHKCVHERVCYNKVAYTFRIKIRTAFDQLLTSFN